MLRRLNLLRSTIRTSQTFIPPLPTRFYSAMSVPAKMRACQIQEQGELDVIQVIEVDTPKPQAGEVLIKVEYAGVNFIDTYQRAGIYKLPMPRTLGNEPAGVVVAVGEGSSFKVGDRVASYTAGGAYAEYCIGKAAQTSVLPDSLSTKEAATVLLQGLTALTFVKEAHEVKPGQDVLIQAAAGGLGLLLVQLAKHFGARVIGTTSTKEKAELAKAAGAEHVILYGGDVNVAEEVYKITGGEGIDRGVHAVFDGVGKDTFEADFDILRRKGTLVTLGNASGPVPPFAPLKLGPKNLKICRPVLNQYVHTAEEFAAYSAELFSLVQQGKLSLATHSDPYEFSAAGIRKTQEDLMSRKTAGKLIVKIA